MFFNNSQYFEFEKELISSNGVKTKIYKFNNEIIDEESLNKWSLGLRNNYVEEKNLNSLINGIGLTQKEYLEKHIFPDPKKPQGAATMSGEFGEILIFDYINFVLKYYVPRTRYFEKVNPSQPVSGSDVIGYKIKDISKPNNSDQLLVAEVKTRSTKSGKKISLDDNPLGKAITGSEKDKVRLAESLNAEKRRLIDRDRYDEANIVERFQNRTDNPFLLDFYAVVVLDSDLYTGSFSDQFILDVINNMKNKSTDKNILIIYSTDLKNFLRDIYRRACLC
ncbi:Hachiman antiphage defense system protein HamA [Dolosigranulum pigrum]|jgi:hypothetical protein|uniref:Hachiman antiphage defense system protein HamA n=1 Tax=Dolosigranulum pigrum TaxID=29394 RepID=UPI001AD87EAC|nr:Hachiman antiphage defense system protein HamA [Dolosigranulum pigrum]QTJ44227.1 DUF1837 domain-containing protein [Dolosigranulum pigrum]